MDTLQSISFPPNNQVMYKNIWLGTAEIVSTLWASLPLDWFTALDESQDATDNDQLFFLPSLLV